MSEENGNHLSFPFRIGVDGKTTQTKDPIQHVKEELIQLLLTNLGGERLFLPEFGGGVRQLIFENNDESSISLTKANISQQIAKWLGHRIELEDLVVSSKNERIDIEIKYRVAGTKDTRLIALSRA